MLFLGSSHCIPEFAQPSKSKGAQLETFVSLHTPGQSLRVLHGDTCPGLSPPRHTGVLFCQGTGRAQGMQRVGESQQC